MAGKDCPNRDPEAACDRASLGGTTEPGWRCAGRSFGPRRRATRDHGVPVRLLSQRGTKTPDRTSCSAKTLTAKCASATVSHRRRHLRNNPTTRYLLRGRPATRLINAGRAPQLVQRCLAMPRNPSSLTRWPGDTRTRGGAIYLCSKYHEPCQSAGGGSCFRPLMRFANIMDG